MTRTKWLVRLKELHSSHANSQFLIGDHVNVGIEAFGRTAAFDAAAEITGTKHTRNFFTRCAAIASYYNKPLRFPKLSFHTYEVLARFPLSFLERFVPAVAESGRSCNQIYSLAVEQYGSDPRKKYKIKLKVVRLPIKLYHALTLRASSPDKTHTLVWKILEDYLAVDIVAAQTAAQGEGPSDGNDAPATTTQPEAPVVSETRPTYSERREQQPIPKRVEKLMKRKSGGKLRMLWAAECAGDSFADTENGAVKFRGATSDKPTKFFSEADAIRAEEENFKQKGFREKVVCCPSCSLQYSTSRVKVQVFHVQHVFSSEVQRAAQQHAQA